MQRFALKKINIFIPVDQFEEIFSALKGSAVDMPAGLVQKIIFLFVWQTPQWR